SSRADPSSPRPAAPGNRRRGLTHQHLRNWRRRGGNCDPAGSASGPPGAPRSLRGKAAGAVYLRYLRAGRRPCRPERVLTMIRIALAFVLLASLTVTLLAAPPEPQVFKGRIKDILGTNGTLTLTLGEGKQLTDRSFLIKGARIVVPGQGELKV